MVARCLAILAAAAGPVEGPGLDRFEFRESHMGSEFTLIFYGADARHASAAARAAFDRIADLDATLSDYRPDSELTRLGDRSGGPPVPVGPDLFEILRRSRALSERTDGAFDVTIGPVVKLWRRARRNRELPPRDRLDEALERVGWRKLELDPEGRAARLSVPGMGLDAGGIAKGFASDAALAVLRSFGIDRALVAGAGDVAAGEPPPGRDGWIVAVAPLDPTAVPKHFLRLRGRAVSTSGDAERYVEIDGTRYSHIVDPRTGVGLTGRSGVTVMAPDAMTSDGLATAISVLGPEAGLELAERLEGVEALIVSAPSGADGPVEHRTSGFDALLLDAPGPPEPDRSFGGPEA